MIRRIDQFVIDFLKFARKTCSQKLHNISTWIRYVYREPITSHEEANKILAQMCNYKIKPGTDVRLYRYVPGIKKGKFGLLVIFVPTKQQSVHWSLWWVKWIDDPLEFYLVRSAANTPLETASDSFQVALPETSLMDNISDRDLDDLLTV